MKKIFLVLILFTAVILLGASCSKDQVNLISPEQAQAKAETFINENLVDPSSPVTVSEVSEQSNLYKFKVTLSDGREVDSFMTKDASYFFTDGIDMKEIEEKAAENNDSPAASAQPVAEVTNKNDKPKVEMFVMSHCPYGTQIEKGMLPVAKLLGDKIDWQLKFCDYAMHGQKELDEQLLQVCIQQEQPEKLIPYLECFLESGDTDSCISETGIDQDTVNACMNQKDDEFNVTANFEDKTGWKGNYPPFNVFAEENKQYGVQGSPTLVINGEQVKSGRDSQSLLTAVCSAFNEAPEECSQELDSASPSPGFGSGTTDNAASGGCAN